MKKILIFGDSHSVIWGKSPFASNIEVFSLGPALAFNLIQEQPDTRSKWFDLIKIKNGGLSKSGKQIFKILSKNQSLKDCAVMLCFGEIDIRTQIVKRAIKNHTNIEYEANKISEKLVLFAKTIYENFGLISFIWEPIATMSSGIDNFNGSYPTVGSELERNYATRIVSAGLREKSNKLLELGFPIYSFGICEKLSPNYLTDAAFYEDGVHLNYIGLDLAVTSFNKLCEKHNLSDFKNFFGYTLLSDKSKKVDYTAKARVTLSSNYDESPQLKRKANSGYCFHTNCDDPAFAVIDLISSHSLNSLEFWNRFDGELERAKKLQVLVGNDLNKMNLVFDCNEVWGFNGDPIIVNFPIDAEPCRFILLKLKEKNYFHLGEIKIHINSFHMAAF